MLLLLRKLIPLFAVAAAGCGGMRTIQVDQYGGMREALMLGQTQGRVTLLDVTAKPGAYGVGSLAGLEGEVTILDGVVTMSTPDGDGLHTAHDLGSATATLLTVGYVGDWDARVLEESIGGIALENAIREAAADLGLAPLQPFPFVILGDTAAYEAHVINGACPAAQPDLADTFQPWRIQSDGQPQEIAVVGIYAENQQGIMTHHDSNVHMHVLAGGGTAPAWTAHLDSLQIDAGAMLLLPSQ